MLSHNSYVIVSDPPLMVIHMDTVNGRIHSSCGIGCIIFLKHASKDGSDQRNFPDQATYGLPADTLFAVPAADCRPVHKPTLKSVRSKI
jgi:hypothetical protein